MCRCYLAPIYLHEKLGYNHYIWCGGNTTIKIVVNISFILFLVVQHTDSREFQSLTPNSN